MRFHIHPIKLANPSHMHSDLALLYSLSFGPVVYQAFGQFTRVFSFHSVPIRIVPQVAGVLLSDTCHQAMITHTGK